MISENIAKLKERVSEVCALTGRNRADVRIVAVTKERSVEDIEQALRAGITDIGENKVQEAAIKFEQLRARNYELKWHMIGHLQTNKVKEAVRIFDLIHSVDSLKLAAVIDKEAARINKIQDVLIEVKTSPEAAKSGFGPEEAPAAAKEIMLLKNVHLKGLMTIAPAVDDPQKARPYFRQLRILAGSIEELSAIKYELSMGMSDDFTIAIEEGATMVRVGRAVFLS